MLSEFGKQLRQRFPLKHHGSLFGRQCWQFTPQKSLRNFVFKTGVADELNVVSTGARKDEFAQHLLAKTVNCQDARLIKMLKRTFDQHCRIMFPRTGALEKGFEFGSFIAVFER